MLVKPLSLHFVLIKIKLLRIITCLLLIVPYTILSQEVSNYSVITKEGRTVSLQALPFIKTPDGKNELYVVIFLGTDCPISQKYSNTLRSLFNSYEDEITFFGIVPNNFMEEEIESFKKDYGIKFDLIKDIDNSFAKTFGARVTPESFLFDSEGIVSYYGAIDDWFYALGRNKLKPTAHYLKDAIADLINNRSVKTPHINAVGCFIEMEEK